MLSVCTKIHVLFWLVFAGGFVWIFCAQEDLSACNGFYPPQLRLLMYVIGGREVGQVLACSEYFRHCPKGSGKLKLIQFDFRWQFSDGPSPYGGLSWQDCSKIDQGCKICIWRWYFMENAKAQNSIDWVGCATNYGFFSSKLGWNPGYLGVSILVSYLGTATSVFWGCHDDHSETTVRHQKTLKSMEPSPIWVQPISTRILICLSLLYQLLGCQICIRRWR